MLTSFKDWQGDIIEAGDVVSYPIQISESAVSMAECEVLTIYERALKVRILSISRPAYGGWLVGVERLLRVPENVSFLRAGV